MTYERFIIHIGWLDYIIITIERCYVIEMMLETSTPVNIHLGTKTSKISDIACGHGQRAY